MDHLDQPGSGASGLLLGHSEIDRQHAELFSLIDRFSALLNRQAGVEALVPAFQLVLSHLQRHFDYEVRLMLAADYPDRERHQKDHERLLSEGAEMLRLLGGTGTAEPKNSTSGGAAGR